MGSNRTYSMKVEDVVNPLLSGCITGQLQAFFTYHLRSIFDDPILKKKLQPLGLLNHIPNKTLLKKDLIHGVICKTASLGTFEIFSKRLRNGNNNGMPLTLYQEACCGVISGATTVLIWQPFEVALRRVGLKNLTYTNWFATIDHIVKNERASTLWRGSRVFSTTNVAAHAGMLASYDRSLNFFVETRGLSKWRAQLSASIVAGFFCAACALPVLYLGAIVEAVRTTRERDAELVYKSLCRMLTPYAGSNFYGMFLKRFLKRFHIATGLCMMQYAIFEGVRGVEWISK